jgi:uncharacterized damage-inducible protein DinB
MSDLKPALDALLQATVHRSGWQPALKPALDGLDAEHAAWRPAPDRNSAHMIVRHLNVWKGAILADLRGEAPDLRAVSAGDWQPQPVDAERWAADLAEVERLAALTEAATGEDLTQMLPNFGTNLGQSLMFLAAHDVYHTGQIMTLRRLQGL